MVKDTTTTSPELNTTDFPQVTPMTFEEKARIYMKCSKLELAKMLAERDRIDYIPQPQSPYGPGYHITCDTDPLAMQAVSVSDSTGNADYCSSTWI